MGNLQHESSFDLCWEGFSNSFEVSTEFGRFFGDSKTAIHDKLFSDYQPTSSNFINFQTPKNYPMSKPVVLHSSNSHSKLFSTINFYFSILRFVQKKFK
jgi:hypothetical protein